MSKSSLMEEEPPARESSIAVPGWQAKASGDGSLFRLISKFLNRLTGGRELWALADQGVVSGVNFLTNIMLARSLGPAQYGVFAIAWMAVLFVNGLQMALIIAPMMSIGPKQRDDQRPYYFGTVVIHELCFGLLSSALVYLAVHVAATFVGGHEVHELSLPLACSALAYLLQDFVRRYLFAVKRIRHSLANDALSSLPQLPIIWVLANQGHLTGSAALWIMGVTSFFGVAAGFFWMEKIRFRRQDFLDVTSRHWRISRWLAPAAVLQWTSGNLFVMVAPVYHGAVAAGVLRASQNIVGVSHVWFLGLDNVVPVEAARRLHDNGVASMARYIKGIIVRWGSVTLLFVLLVGIAPQFWLRLAYGESYAQYGYVLRLYSVLYLLVFLGGPLRAGLQALEFTSPIFWSYSIMTISSVVLAVPVAKWLGLVGVMVGTIVTLLVFQSVVAIALFRRTRYLKSLQTGHTGSSAMPTGGLTDMKQATCSDS